MNQSRYEMGPEEMLGCLRKIYHYYACLGVTSNGNLLSNQNLLKLFKDSEVHSPSLTPKDIQLLIYSEKRTKNIDFETFCEILGRVALVKFPSSRETPATEALFKFFDEHILELYYNLVSTGKILDFEETDCQIDDDTLEIILTAKEPLWNIYKSNFAWELYSSEPQSVIAKKSEEAFMALISDYKITPDLISNGLAKRLWCDIIHCVQNLECFFNFKEEGQYFTLKKFLMCLLRCSLLGKYVQKVLSPSEKLVVFLEKLEMSSFSGVSTQQIRTQTLSLLTSKRVLKLMQTAHKENLEQNLKTLDKFEVTESRANLEIHIEQLESVFNAYCILGNKTNLRKMNSYNFLKLLCDAKIIKSSKQGISSAEAHLVFLKALTYKAPKTTEQPFKEKHHLIPKENDCRKLSFKQFLYALETISSKLYTGMGEEEAYINLVESHILPLEALLKGTESYLRAVLSILKEKHLDNSMESLSNSLRTYSKHYFDKHNKMNFANFMNFCSDFSIFPDVLPRKSLTWIFSTVSSMHRKSITISSAISLPNANFQEGELVSIDFENFVQAIGICALESTNAKGGAYEKIQYLLEKIFQSRGVSEVTLKTGYTRTGELEHSDFLRNRTPKEKPRFKDLLWGSIK